MSRALRREPINMLWTGRILTAIGAVFMVMDAVMHMLKPAPVVEAFNHLGYGLNTAVPLGVTVLICTTLYAVPRTSFFGALLLTGYLGGAVASHLRVGDPVFNMCFPAIIATLLWAGLYLRDARLQAVLRS
jgi:hypothetical protein